MNKHHFLYFHGGPGLNSSYEALVLPAVFAKLGATLHLWNEPSVNRPKGDSYTPKAPMRGWLDSAERFLLRTVKKCGPVHVLAHCFACEPTIALAAKHPNSMRAITFITPGFDLHDVQKNILKIAKKNFQQRKNKKNTNLLSGYLKKTVRIFDSSIEKGFRVAFQDPDLLPSYWNSSRALEGYLRACSKSETQIDIDAFFGVLKAYSGWKKDLKLLFKKNNTLPVLLVFGKDDPVVSQTKEINLGKRLFSKTIIKVFQKSRHFPHLEESDAFVKTLIKFERQFISRSAL